MTRLLKVLLTVFILPSVYITGYSQCQSAPNEGYRGTCAITVAVSRDATLVYTSSGEVIKEWDFNSKTVNREWQVAEGVKSLLSVSIDGRYIRYSDKNSTIQLFDTETGSTIRFEEYSVHAILPALNTAVVSDVKSRTANMIKSYYTKLYLYDLNTKKTRVLGEYRGQTAIAEKGGRVAWRNDDVVTVFDMSKNKEVLATEGGYYFNLSDDGRYLVTDRGFTAVDSKKLTPFAQPSDDQADFIFSNDSQSLLVVNHAMTMNYGWKYGFKALKKFNLATGKEEGDFSSGWPALTEMQNAYRVFGAGNSQQIMVFGEKKVALTELESIRSVKDSLDLFGNIGAGGKAQISKEEAEKARMASLKQNMASKFETLQGSGFEFPQGHFLHILDYNTDSGMILIGDVFQAGLFKMPEGTLIHGFGPYNTMALGPADKAVKVGLEVVGGCVSPDGSLVALSVNKYTELYKNGQFLQKMDGPVFVKLLNDHQAIANIDEKLVLYDFIQKKILVTYAKDQWECKLSPDRTKVLVAGEKVCDVQSGKVLYSSKKPIGDITDTKAIFFDGGQPRAVDLSTGKDITITGYNAERMGRYPILEAAHVLSNNEGPLLVFDVDNMRYVSNEPVLSLARNSMMELHAYFRKSNSLFVLTKNAGATFRINDDTEYASGFTLDAKTGDLTPHLFHAGRKKAAEIAQKEKEASAEDPDVANLLGSFKYFPSSYQFNYSNFDFIDLTNNSVARKYFTYIGNDKVYGIGRFCQAFGRTKVLGLIVKNPGPNEQYNFILMEFGPKGIEKNDIIATTQKVNGNVTELANVNVSKSGTSFIITVNTESSSGTRSKTFTVPGGCN